MAKKRRGKARQGKIRSVELPMLPTYERLRHAEQGAQVEVATEVEGRYAHARRMMSTVETLTKRGRLDSRQLDASERLASDYAIFVQAGIKAKDLTGRVGGTDCGSSYLPDLVLEATRRYKAVMEAIGDDRARRMLQLVVCEDQTVSDASRVLRIRNGTGTFILGAGLDIVAEWFEKYRRQASTRFPR
ncbi:MAG: hypothetical protein RLO50_03385 [Azospirillaceae bacterium]